MTITRLSLKYLIHTILSVQILKILKK